LELVTVFEDDRMLAWLFRLPFRVVGVVIVLPFKVAGWFLAVPFRVGGWFFRPPGRKVITKPEQLVPHVLENFYALTETDISGFERLLGRVSPRNSELHLLYALRVSKCVPGIKSFDTLASRWGVACVGAGGAGLVNGATSPNYRATYAFLAALFSERFSELCRELIAKAEQTAIARKTLTSKRKVYEQAIHKIANAKNILLDLPAIESQADNWLVYLRELESRLNA
jgi:hypothetical protein